MTVHVGDRIGQYEVLAALGKGGMGEVWKARDTRLRREVALKTLPPSLARDPERLARLGREAELLAQLNHPNVAAIYGIEEHGDTSVLVLELVAGPTLDDRIRRGPLPVAEALNVALQIAQALEATHGKGIIHRDLKPSNIKLSADGRVKVLDFGLGKALASVSTDADTITVHETQAGVVMGTPGYMSPEQARGDVVGFQTDIWAFGVVLYQMLTGMSPFRQSTPADTLARVLSAEPDYSALPQDTPLPVRRLIQRCLQKDPTRRAHHIGDVRLDVQDALAVMSGSGDTPLAAEHGRRRAVWKWIAAIVAAALASGLAVWSLAPRRDAANPLAAMHVSMPFAGLPVAPPMGSRHLAISRDGVSVAFASTAGLQVRRFGDKNALVTIVPGGINNPAFSPDGEWIAVAGETRLMKISARGGKPLPLVDSTDRAMGLSWRGSDTIIFGTSLGLYEVSATGGPAKLLIKPDRNRHELLYAWPHVLPNRRTLLFTIVGDGTTGGPKIALLDLETLQSRPIVDGSSPVYVPSGHLVFASGSTLNAVAFDAATGTTRGKTIGFPEIDLTVAVDNGAANYALSDTGTLIHAPPRFLPLLTLEWIDRHGTRTALPVEPQRYQYPTVSPDGSRVAVERTTGGNRDIWILDLKRLTQMQLTDGPTEDMLPLWSVDGQRVFFASRRTGDFDVYSQAADGATPARLEFAAPEFQTPATFTPEGSRLLVYDRFRDTSILNLKQPDRLEPLLHAEFDERLSQISPDGAWIAYESDESGNQVEIILRSFPNVTARREKISTNGGRYPRWDRKGRELYYLAPDGGMMAVPIQLSPALAIGAPKKLFEWQKPPVSRTGPLYDVARDGRFIVTRPVEVKPDTATNVSVILNWLTEAQNKMGR